MKENNKIIAEFLDWTLVSYPTHMKSPFHGQNVWWSPGTTKSFCCIEGKEFFKDSWEWLMPVIKKIRNNPLVTNVNYNIEGDFIIEGLTSTEKLDIIINREDFKSDLEMCYFGVVEFIKWYNKQKEE